VAYERGWLARKQLSCRVVSVGNATVGGSAKTPSTAWLALALRRRGWRVAIASRGYGRLGRERVEVVSDGRFVRSRAEVAGDEPMWLAGRAPGVPVLVGRHRDVVGLRAVAAFGAQVVVLDDGFQHHRLHRDVDVVMVDARAGFGSRRVLPRGPLREPARALSRAHAVGVVDGPLREADRALLERHAPAAFRFELRRRAAWLRPLGGAAHRPVSGLAGRPVGLLSGLAGPDGFRATVEGLGARVVAERAFPDHHRYRRHDLDGLSAEAPLWITTEKDALKLAPEWTDAELLVLGLELDVEDPDGLLDWLEGRLRARPIGRDAALPARRTG
jgi:tetraacyldisaccharide 4'-kinase